MDCPACDAQLSEISIDGTSNEYGSDAERRQAADRYFETVLRQAVLRNP